MPFSYYQRLNRRQQAIYRASDKVPEVRLPTPDIARKHADELSRALAAEPNSAEQRAAVARAANRLAREICTQLGIDPVRVRVLACRPRSAGSELHGLYTWEQGEQAEIKLWMRTAQRRQVVAYKAFLRTLLHEIGHHLDYHLYKLADSFHTQGFFQRESSLARQLLAGPERSPTRKPTARPRPDQRSKPAPEADAKPERVPRRSRSRQLDLPW